MAKSFKEIIEKFNPYHDRLGRFTHAGGASFMTIRTKDPSKQKWADMAVARAKDAEAKKKPDFAGQISSIKADSDKIKAQIADAQKEDRECAYKIQELKAEERRIQAKVYDYEALSRRFDGSKYKDGYDVDEANKKIADLDSEYQKVSQEIEMYYRDRPQRGTPEYDEWKEYRDTHDIDAMMTRSFDLQSQKMEIDQEIKAYERYKTYKDGAAEQEQLKARLAEIDGEKEALVTKRLEVQDRIPELAKQNEVNIKKAGKLVADEVEKSSNAKVAQKQARVEEIDKTLSEAETTRKELYKRLQDGNISEDEYWAWQNNNAQTGYKLTTEKRALQKEIDGAGGESLKAELSKVRSMGVSEEQSKNMKTHLPGRSTVKQAVRDAYENYPTEWVEQSMQRGAITTRKTDRGHYADYKGEITISGYSSESQKSTAIHELGHRMEAAVPGIREAEQAFYNRRTAGESRQRLKDVTGINYGNDEMTRKDKFLDAYMGKDYGGSYYELVSMGFEMAYNNPKKLATDPDYQQFIYGLLAIG